MSKKKKKFLCFPNFCDKNIFILVSTPEATIYDDKMNF